MVFFKQPLMSFPQHEWALPFADAAGRTRQARLPFAATLLGWALKLDGPLRGPLRSSWWHSTPTSSADLRRRRPIRNGDGAQAGAYTLTAAHAAATALYSGEPLPYSAVAAFNVAVLAAA